MTWAQRMTLAVGNYVFRYRNAMFPIIFVLLALWGAPRMLFGNPTVDQWLMRCGVVIALLGETVRLSTIGFQYIERGGKNRRIYASFLANRGMYALTRNPMYLGNILIALGMTMVAGSPIAYTIVLPFFLFVYHAIVVAEEAYLRGQFGEAYARYCADVPRWGLSLRRMRDAFAGMTYDWRRSVRKELSTITGLLTGLILLPVWRTYFLQGFAAAKAQAPTAACLMLLVLAAFAYLSHLKKQRRLFYLPAEL